jgi:serine/threonine protein kinase
MNSSIENYALTKFLGKGAYGDVYLALDQSQNIEVAIKCVNKLKLYISSLT